jgi:hypothetical protein
MLFLFLQGLSLPPDSKFFKLRHAWVYEIGLSHMLQLEVLQKACALIWPCTQIVGKWRRKVTIEMVEDVNKSTKTLCKS